MRSLIPVILVVGPFVACGDGPAPGSGSDTDAGEVVVDSGTDIDSAVGDIDAAPIPEDTAAYFVGDFTTNNVLELGRATFPGPAVSALSLDGIPATPFLRVGVARAGNVIVAAAYDNSTITIIRAYDSDLGNPRTLLSDETGAVSINDLAVSPDGALVAITADLDTDNAHRLYVIPTSGTGSPKALHPDTGNAQRDTDRIMWSRDSAHILFRGDLETNNHNQAWVVDATAATPTPVELTASVTLTGGAGVNDLVGFDNAGKVYFQSDHASDGSDSLYRADPGGGNFEEVPFTAALMNGDGKATIGKCAFNSVGTRLAFSADAPTDNVYQVYVTDIASPAPAVVSAVISESAQERGPLRNNPMVWSPDDSLIAAGADWEDGDNDTAIFMLPTSGTPGGTKLVAPISGGDVQALAFALDSASLFAVGNMDDATDTKLYHLTDLSTADQDASTLILQDVPASGDIAAESLQVVAE
ncbi:MAG: hypothetical protein KJO07_16105 [Deltaproteobacteria bacterium]|jgi:hypothetical protein|nr:hypothetical protein [Deltaproteobacteria bacterium]